MQCFLYHVLDRFVNISRSNTNPSRPLEVKTPARHAWASHLSFTKCPSTKNIYHAHLPKHIFLSQLFTPSAAANETQTTTTMTIFHQQTEMNKTHIVCSFPNTNQTSTLPNTSIHLAYLHMSYGQNLVHGERTSLSRVGPYRFCSGGTLYKPSWEYRFGYRFRVGPYRFCSDGYPTTLSILLWSYLILSDTHMYI